MNADQLRDALEKLKISQVELSKLAGVHERTSRHWALEGHRIPELLDIVLAALLTRRLRIKDVRRLREYFSRR